MRVMVGVTFVIAVIALALHLRPLVSAPIQPASVNISARLQRECESVVDTAGVLVSPAEVLLALERTIPP